MSHARLTDAELVDRLRKQEEVGPSKAAAFYGLSKSAFRESLREARERGLTPATKIKDPLALAQAKLKVAEARVRELEREDESAAKIREEIWKIEAHSPEPPKWLFQNGANGFRGMPTIFASDWHYGEVVRKDEMGGLNEFNAEIAEKRIKRLTETTIDLCFNHMGKAKTVYPGLVYPLGGDMISGDIHEELFATNDRTPQQCINDLTDLIGGSIEAFAAKFGRVHIPCVTGNHGRASRKPRYKGRVFTSHEWNIYCNLSREFKRSKHVTFQIPNQTDCRYSVYGHRYLLTHGDNLGVKGGDGIIGALGPIRRGEIKVRNAESQINQDFDTMIIGHWHQYLPLPGLIVNNCLKGYDEYARLALRAPYSRPSQALWFTHPEHGITAHWQVYLDKSGSAEPQKTLEWTA